MDNAANAKLLSQAYGIKTVKDQAVRISCLKPNAGFTLPDRRANSETREV